jgi:hypothetical protein
MHPDVSSALIGAVAAFIVALLTMSAGRVAELRGERKRIKSQYLNPLRLFAEEAHYRMEDMFRFPGNRAALGGETPETVSAKPAAWFNEAGCYFASTCYFTACLFAAMRRVREGIPYLRMSGAADTELLTRILAVSHEFLDDDGVYYVVQHSIGEQTWDPGAKGMMSYRTFCQALQDPSRRVWFDRLLAFYMDVGAGRRLEQLKRAQTALEALSRLLDGGVAIQARKQVERSRWTSRQDAAPHPAAG